VTRQTERPKLPAAGSECCSDPERKQQLIGKKLADRNARFEIPPSLSRRIFGDLFGPFRFLAEPGKDLGNVLRPDLDENLRSHHP